MIWILLSQDAFLATRRIPNLTCKTYCRQSAFFTIQFAYCSRFSAWGLKVFYIISLRTKCNYQFPSNTRISSNKSTVWCHISRNIKTFYSSWHFRCALYGFPIFTDRFVFFQSSIKPLTKHGTRRQNTKQICLFSASEVWKKAF